MCVGWHCKILCCLTTTLRSHLPPPTFCTEFRFPELIDDVQRVQDVIVEVQCQVLYTMELCPISCDVNKKNPGYCRILLLSNHRLCNLQSVKINSKYDVSPRRVRDAGIEINSIHAFECYITRTSSTCVILL